MSDKKVPAPARGLLDLSRDMTPSEILNLEEIMTPGNSPTNAEEVSLKRSLDRVAADFDKYYL